MKTSRIIKIIFLRLITWLSALTVLFIGLSIICYILAKGLPNLSTELVFTKPSYLNNTIGILPNILCTVYIIIATSTIVLPLGVGAAIYLTEYAEHKRVVAIIEFTAEILSGIPSIIYGLVGMLIFSNNLGTCILSGALTLSVMNLPTVMRTTQESLKSVPQSHREAAFALGAGKWTVIKSIVIPESTNGILTSCIIIIGRILGETSALLFTAGFADNVTGIFSGMTSAGATLSVALYVYSKEEGEFGVAFAIAAILLVLSALINLTIVYIERKLRSENLT